MLPAVGAGGARSLACEFKLSVDGHRPLTVVARTCTPHELGCAL